MTLFFADSFEPMDVIGGSLQFGGRERFEILDDGFEPAHVPKLPRLRRCGKFQHSWYLRTAFKSVSKRGRRGCVRALFLAGLFRKSLLSFERRVVRIL